MWINPMWSSNSDMTSYLTLSCVKILLARAESLSTKGFDKGGSCVLMLALALWTADHSKTSKRQVTYVNKRWHRMSKYSWEYFFSDSTSGIELTNTYSLWYNLKFLIFVWHVSFTQESVNVNRDMPDRLISDIVVYDVPFGEHLNHIF